MATNHRRVMPRMRLAWCFLLVLLMVLPSLASAARHTVAGWGMEQGLPHNLVQSVAQDKDGFIWLGTWEGVVRFNGRSFTVFDRQNTPGVELSGVPSLLAERDGGMLFGTVNNGLYRYYRGRWEALGGDAARHLSITALWRDTDGTLWVGAQERLLKLSSSGQLEDVALAPALPAAGITGLLRVPGGDLLVATERGIFQIHGGHPSPWPDSANWVVRDLIEDDAGGWIVATDDGVFWKHRNAQTEHLFPGERVDKVRRDAAGGLWLSFSAGRLERYSDGRRERITVPGQVSPALTVDREGLVWAGSTDGLFRIDEGAAQGLSEADGLGSNYVRAVLQTSDGAIWIGHSQGLDKVVDGQIHRVRLIATGARDASVLALAATAGGVWVGTYNQGVLRLDLQGKVLQTIVLPGTVQPLVRSLFVDTDGSLWIGSAEGLFHFVGGRLLHYGAEEGLPGPAVHALYRDVSGVLWIGTNAGMASMDTDGKLQSWSQEKGFPASYVFDFLGDANGDLWIASDHGLLRKRGLEVLAFDHQKGLPRDKIFRIIDDGQGHLWLPSNQGVFRLDRSDLVAVAADARSHLAVHVVDHTDGMPSSQGNGASSPAGWLALDGRLMFPTAGGLALIDPRRVGDGGRARRAPVVIEDVIVDGAPQALQAHYLLSPTTERVAVAYAGLGFRAPDKMRYRYRLEGFDTDWVDAGSRTEAVYTNLAPGRYRLRVQAMTLPLDWEDSLRVGEADVALDVATPYWRRPWVMAVALLVLTGLVLALVAWRTATYRRRQRKLSTEIAARTQELSEKNRALEQADFERDSLLRRLEHMAMHDALTELPNRRAGDAHLQLAMREADKMGEPLHVALLDIDHFKLINDRLGHEAGDQVLRDVAGLLRLQLSGPQFVSRHGGEEFLIVLRGIPADKALEQLQALRLQLARLRLGEQEGDLRITVSMGMATQGPGQQTVRTLLAAADQRLYRAKHEGRNRVVN